MTEILLMFLALFSVMGGIFSIAMNSWKRLIICILLFFSCFYLLEKRKDRKAKNNKDIIVHVDQLLIKGQGDLYYGDTLVEVERNIPPLLWLRCKEEILLRRYYGDYYLPIEGNL